MNARQLMKYFSNRNIQIRDGRVRRSDLLAIVEAGTTYAPGDNLDDISVNEVKDYITAIQETDSIDEDTKDILIEYLELKEAVAENRLEGQIDNARHIERSMDRLFGKLPYTYQW